MRNRLVTATVLTIAAFLAAWTTGQTVVARATEFTPPPLRTDLLDDFTQSARIEHISRHLWRVDGLPVVVARGQPEEMGRQYGQAMADEIKQALRVYLIGKVVKEWGYPLEYQRLCARAMRPHIPSEYIQEMKGVAAGAGVDFDDVLLMHTHADTVHYGKSWGRPDSAPGKECSNFAVWGRWTVDGQLIHGRNLDWTTSTGVQRLAVVYVGIPDNGIPFALVTYAGLIGGVTGMNAQGITFGEMTSSSSRETLDGMPLMIICRKILQYCHTIDEAVQTVRSYPRTTGWNFLIGDGKVPTARALEVDAEDVVVFEPGDPKENDPPIHWPMPDCVRRTNHFISRKMQLKQAKRAGVPYALGRAAIRGLDTWQRYASLSHWIKTHRGKIDARLARALLQTPPVAGNGNLHSVVMVPAKGMMWVANAGWRDGKAEPAWSQHYVPVDLSRFWPRGRGRPEVGQ